MRHVLPLLLLLSTAAPAMASARPAAHDKHVSYGQMAVEGRTAFVRIRFFGHDLEAALQRYHEDPSLRLEASPHVEDLLAVYFDEHFHLTSAGERLAGRVVGSGEDGEMWWVAVRFDAPAPLASFTLRNTLLFDAFPEQRNTVQVARFPEGRTQTLYFTRGAEVYDVAA